jgi:hypothetical protein
MLVDVLQFRFHDSNGLDDVFVPGKHSPHQLRDPVRFDVDLTRGVSQFH